VGVGVGGQTGGDRQAAERGKEREGAAKARRRSPEGARKEQGRRMEGAEGDLITPAATQQPRRRLLPREAPGYLLPIYMILVLVL
jgi:hypothetical protein